MLKSGFLMIWTSFVAQCVPVLVTFISFAVYSAVSPTPLTPEVAFSSLALFNLLVIPMMLIPTTVQVLVNAIVSMDRLQSFFASPEIEKHDNGRPPFDDGLEEDDVANQSRKSGGNLKITDEKTRNLLDNRESSSYGTFETSLSEATIPTTYLPDHLSIQISGGHFAWDIDSDVAILHDIDLEVPIDTLTIIIGMVGAGKSSLLSAILGEMSTLAGNIYFNRKRNIISYCPQRAWLQNSTLRANILFGEPMDHTRYNTILDACALRPDIDILPAGDMTEIGEKGINLSGGQKQRISVARALYNKSDIVLMDDPFSALDVHVGSQLMKEGILGFLKREQRTVILVTHQLQYLKYADTVISMDNCTIADQGNLNEIRKRDPNLYAVWEKRISFLSDSEDDDDSSEETTKLERLKLIEQVTGKHEQHRQDDSAAGTLMEKEEREVGSVSLKVYLSYAKAIKYSLTCLTLLLYVAQGTMLILTNFWLSAWSESGSETANKTQEDLDDELTYYIRGYAALSFSYIGISLVAISCQIMFSLYGARRVHIKLLRNIIHAPMRFFDTTPVGRVLNRFSNDTNIIDQRLWMVMFSILSNASVLISAIVVNAVVSPIFIAGAAPLFLIYILIQRYFISTARELQRLGSISRSPVFAHFSESLEGLTTIRAYRNEKRFRRQLHTSVDTNNIAMVCLTLVNRWMGVRLEFIGAVVVLISGLSGLLTALFGELEPSLVGLALTYALSISGHSAILVRSTADCEMQMNAVERIRYYTNVESEQYEGVYNPPPDWPTDGDIKIENISVRYDPSLEPVLRDVSIHFKGGQRVGICGRTGSGKSSLAASLFQIVDTFKGRILIDGVDISHIPLLTLRKRLSIIPQDPVLFQGTIRFNLDPENLRSDDEIWEALEIAQLKQVVTELDMQLDADISEDGVNFSLGQRQLFCIARAFLRKSRILLMDEATASIDLKTDKLLQDVVATAFADRTVITIAHRISTILDSDTVVVLSDGRVVEYDTPENLLKKEDGIFASFVQGSLDN
ncbi:ATP-binding cassette sub-family C member 9-like [Saccoglossus kowalevskii]